MGVVPVPDQGVGVHQGRINDGNPAQVVVVGLTHTEKDRAARTLSAWSISTSLTIATLRALWALLASVTSPRTAIAIAGVLILPTPRLLPRGEQVLVDSADPSGGHDDLHEPGLEEWAWCAAPTSPQAMAGRRNGRARVPGPELRDRHVGRAEDPEHPGVRRADCVGM